MPRHPSGAAQPPAPETPDERTARVAALRRAYLDGTLVTTFSEESRGFERLLEDLRARARLG